MHMYICMVLISKTSTAMAIDTGNDRNVDNIYMYICLFRCIYICICIDVHKCKDT